MSLGFDIDRIVSRSSSVAFLRTPFSPVVDNDDREVTDGVASKRAFTQQSKCLRRA